MSAISSLTSSLGPSISALLSLSLAIALGLLLGQVKVRGIRLGVAGVLFSSLALAQLGVPFQQEALPFVRDLSLVLFVYALGLQVGPGFVASLRAEGLRLNLLAAAALVLAGALAAVLARMLAVGRDGASGVYAGALNSTPALAGAQVVMQQIFASQPDRAAGAMASSSLAYAVTYPFGVVGPILIIAALKRLFRIKMSQERASLEAQQHSQRHASIMVDFEIVPGPYVGQSIRDLPPSLRGGVVLSRLYRAGTVTAPRAGTVLQAGDIIRVVGDPEEVRRFGGALGRPSAVDLSGIAGGIRRADLVVTRTAVLRRPLRELNLRARSGVTIARVNRAGVDLVPHAGLSLKFGDQVTAVGPESGLQQVAQELGNEPQALNVSHLVPLFVGIVLGVVVGAIPLALPGLPAPLRIGLAGGPFIVAIAVSQIGSLGPMIWYMPVAANRLVQDLGLSVFLACIGFQSGPGLLERAIQAGPGLIVAGGLVTFLPVFLVACVARRVLRMNFITLSGWVAGTLTSLPALAFASDEADTDAPALAYASVAPLCEVLPIILAELITLILS